MSFPKRKKRKQDGHASLGVCLAWHCGNVPYKDRDSFKGHLWGRRVICCVGGVMAFLVGFGVLQELFF